jgi:cation diffusion facilitator family transporter
MTRLRPAANTFPPSTPVAPACPIARTMASPFKKWSQHIPPAEARAVLISMGVGCTLLAIKFYAWSLTGSTAIFSDALESIVNVMAAAFACYSLYVAHQPADPEHPYGHGKVEFLSAGFEGGMILVASVVIIVEAARTIFEGPHVGDLRWGFVLIASAMLVHFVLGIYLVRAGKKHRSITLEADGRHLLADAITSAMALLSLVAVKLTGWQYADPIGAILVALFIGRTGISLLGRSAAGLMDKQDRADDLLLRQILDAHLPPTGREPQICSYHKLRHRHSGRYHWVDFHIRVPAGWDIARGHVIATAIEHEIEHALGEGDATAHVEPCGNAGCAVCGSKAGAETSLS